MIILCSGSHGTGKSTFAQKLALYLAEKGYTLSDSVSEKFFKREDFKNQEKMPKLQEEFTDYQLKVFSGEMFGLDTISSRSFADIWAYTKYLYDQSKNPAYLDQLETIETSFKENLEKIADGELLIVYFPIRFKIEGKELRSTNEDFQREIDGNIQKFFEKVNFLPYNIPEGNAEESFELFLDQFPMIRN